MLKKIKKCSIFASSLNIVLYADSKLSRLNAAAAHESANSSCSVFFLIKTTYDEIKNQKYCEVEHSECVIVYHLNS